MSDRGSVFDDGKAEDALRTIGEVSDALDIKPHILRYWEQQFPMLQPMTRAGGRRYYRSDDIAVIQRIDALVNEEGYTLKGARQALENAPDKPVENTAEETPSSVFGPNTAPADDGGVATFFGQMPDAKDARPAAKTVSKLKAIRDALSAAVDA
ncbi:MAG: MerR family transcriptional regulator [Parerythrobacter sp.]